MQRKAKEKIIKKQERKKTRCPLPGLNQRPLDLQSNALPAELRELTLTNFLNVPFVSSLTLSRDSNHNIKAESNLLVLSLIMYHV